MVRIAPLYQAHTIMNGMKWNGLMAYMIELEGALLPVACAGPQCQRASYAVILRNMKLGSYRVGVMKWQVMRCWTDFDRCMYRY